ncbi:hypothetical protein BDQ17DRAFT_1352143 [Cyathus striatus]|nr:hypothetical protein BDQ17DRAFT_1352143 [Cyathus striatus]
MCITQKKIRLVKKQERIQAAKEAEQSRLKAAWEVFPPPLVTPTPPSPLSPMEATLYYYGLPSHPVLVARTSTTVWEPPTGLDDYQRMKEIHGTCQYAFEPAWDNGLHEKLYEFLTSKGVNCSAINLVRIGYWEQDCYPAVYTPILWIGVMPGSLSGDDGLLVARECLKIVEEYGITGIEVEIREAIGIS